MKSKIITSLIELLGLSFLGVIWVEVFLCPSRDILVFLLEFLYVASGPLAMLTALQYLEYFDLIVPLTIFIVGVVTFLSWIVLILLKNPVSKKFLIIPVLTWVLLGVLVLWGLSMFAT